MDKHDQAFKVSVETGFADDGSITQCVRWPHSNQSIVTQVINTQEKGIREALIKLGWTPPGEVAPGEVYARLKVVPMDDLKDLCRDIYNSMLRRELNQGHLDPEILFLRAMAVVCQRLRVAGMIHIADKNK